MGIQGKKVVWFLLFLTVMIAPFGGAAISQESKAEKGIPAETSKTVSPPGLADLFALSAGLENRLTVLERDLAERFDSTVIEQRFLQLNERLDTLSGRLQELKISKRYDYNQLAEIRERLLTENSSLQRIRAPATERIKKIELWSKEWSEEDKRWKELQSSLAKDTSVGALGSTFAEARETIDKAQKLLAKDLKPVLAAEQKGAEIQARIDGLLAEVGGYLRILRGDILRKSAPAMFSADYYARFSRGLWEETKKGLEVISWPGLRLFERHGLKLPLQVFLSLILTAFILRKRSSLAAEPRLRFLADRPFSAGMFAGFVTISLLYGPTVGAWRAVLVVVISICLVRVAGGLIETGWRKRLIYVLIMLFVSLELLQFIALPLPLFRGYVFLVALIGLCLCGQRALRSPREGESRVYRWTLNLGVAVSGVIFIAELIGYSGLATHLLDSALTTAFALVAAWILMRLARGGLEWTLYNTGLVKIPLLRKNAAVIVARTAGLIDFLLGAFVFVSLLAVWGVYGSQGEAMRGVLTLGVSIGSFRLTVGVVFIATLLLYASILASRAVQSVLTEEVFPRRQVERGAQISMARLVHYGFVLIGFFIALRALGFDLRNVTIIGGALGVGIGFGLQQVVNNFVCGIILLFERPISVGDYIELDGEWAEIKEIGLRATIVQNFDRADLVIPNSDLITNRVINWTLSDRMARIKIPVGVAYGSDVPLVMKILQECAAENSALAKSPEPRVIFVGFGDSSLDFELRAHLLDIDSWFITRTEVVEEIERKFRESGIQIPFPQRDLHLRSVDESVTATSPPPGLKHLHLVPEEQGEEEE